MKHRLELKKIEEDFHMRFYRHEKLASWPTPWGEISTGKFVIENDGKIVIDGDSRGMITVNENLLSMSNLKEYTTVYRRVVPD